MIDPQHLYQSNEGADAAMSQRFVRLEAVATRW
jgi:hypothetical protein